MRILWLGLYLAIGATCTRASTAPFWVAWEGNDHPENEGWARSHFGDSGPPAIRSLSDGVMTLNGLASIEIVDVYRLFRTVNPDIGEEFIMQWRLRVNEVGNPNSQFDPGLAVYSDDAWHLILVTGVDKARSVLEQQEIVFDRGLFHAWELRSPDMRSYSLSLNGTIVRTGAFTQTGAVQSRISWGDIVAGSNSHSDWDYFRVGVVPEPSTKACALFMLLLGRKALTRRCP